MNFNITFYPNNIQFISKYNETILNAAIKKKIPINYNCKNGICGLCKAQIISGKFYITNNKIKQNKIKDNIFPLCCIIAKTNLKIELIQNKIKKIKCNIIEIYKITKKITILKLKLKSKKEFKYKSGQYINIIIEKNQRRSYSIANMQNKNNIIELHIKKIKKGLFTEKILPNLKINNEIEIEGPIGSFYLHKISNNSIIFLASSTGFAPIKSIIEEIIYKKIINKIEFYWEGRKKQDLYMLNLAKKWEKQNYISKFTPILSNYKKNNLKNKKTFSYNLIIKDHKDLSNYQIYACGTQNFIKTSKKKLIKKSKLKNKNFFSDIFT